MSYLSINLSIYLVTRTELYHLAIYLLTRNYVCHIYLSFKTIQYTIFIYLVTLSLSSLSIYPSSNKELCMSSLSFYLFICLSIYLSIQYLESMYVISIVKIYKPILTLSITSINIDKIENWKISKTLTELNIFAIKKHN